MPIPKGSVSSEALAHLKEDRHKDAQCLFDAGRYDGAFYLAGYAVELHLKWLVCQVLNWSCFPPDGSREFQQLKTHNLDALLQLTGAYNRLLEDKDWKKHWSNFTSNWSPELRYSVEASIDRSVCADRLQSVEKILNFLDDEVIRGKIV